MLKVLVVYAFFRSLHYERLGAGVGLLGGGEAAS